MMVWCSVNRALRMAISYQNKTSMPDDLKSEWTDMQGCLQWVFDLYKHSKE